MSLKSKSAIPLAVLTLITVLITSCSDGRSVAPPDPPALTIVLSPSPASVSVSDYTFVIAHAYDYSGKLVSAEGLKWTTENDSLAYVSVQSDTIASVWGKRPGKTAVVASYGGVSARVTLSVLPPTVAKVVVAPGVAAVENGTQRKLALILLNAHGMANGSGVASWSSSNPSVASVDQTGIVTAHAEGTVTIQAKSDTAVGSATVHVPSAFTAVAAGNAHSCAVKSDGRIVCWGSNSAGQLGDGTTLARPAPVQVQSNVKFSAATILNDASCALSVSKEVYCWGANPNGRLGVGTGAVTTPARVLAQEPFAQVVSGAFHICALGVSGKTYCWGPGAATGISGSNPIAPTAVPTPVEFSAVVAGATHTCGLGLDRRAYCWGNNKSGQLGDSATIEAMAAGRTSIAPVSGGVQFKSLHAGSAADVTCGIALDLATYCWGDYVESNSAPTTRVCSYGYQKSGAVVENYCSPMPVRITSSVAFTTAGTAGGAVCGINSAGEAYCSGYAYGPDGYVKFPAATKVLTSVKFSSISGGATHWCGLSVSKSIYCWGSNTSGTIGDYSSVPVPPSPYGIVVVRFPSLIASP